MLARTAAEYFFLAGCVLLALWLLGLPVQLGLRLLGQERVHIPTPMLGMAVAAIGGWYVYDLGIGLRPVFQIGCLLGVAAAVACVVVRRRTLRSDGRELAARLKLPAAIAGGTALVMVFAVGSIFSVEYPTVITGGNGDIANYAIVGQHIADFGPDDAGSIAGFQMGERATAYFDFGPAALVAASSAAGPFGDVWRYLMPLLGIVTGLVAYSVAMCLDRLLPGRLLLAAIAGIAGICPFLFQYVWSQYFLNQISAMSLVLVACLVIMWGATRRSARSRAAHAVGAAALIATLVAGYPHVLVAGPALLLPPLFFAEGLHDIGRRLLALVVQGLAALLVAFCLLPTLALRLPDTIRFLGNTTAGWPLPGFLPVEVLGDLSTEYPVHDDAWEWVPSIVVLALLAAACIFVLVAKVAPRLAWFTLLLYGLCLGSYGLVFLSEGPSYRQWKWITQYTPILVGAAVLVAMVLIAHALRRASWGPAMAVAAGVTYCIVAVVAASPVTFTVGRPFPLATVPLDLLSLETAPQLRGIEELNVDVSPHWETAWVSYFLRDHELHLQDPSAYAVSRPTATWTVERVDTPGATPPLEVRPINATYQLVRR